MRRRCASSGAINRCRKTQSVTTSSSTFVFRFFSFFKFFFSFFLHLHHHHILLLPPPPPPFVDCVPVSLTSVFLTLPLFTSTFYFHFHFHVQFHRIPPIIPAVPTDWPRGHRAHREREREKERGKYLKKKKYVFFKLVSSWKRKMEIKLLKGKKKNPTPTADAAGFPLTPRGHIPKRRPRCAGTRRGMEQIKRRSRLPSRLRPTSTGSTELVFLYRCFFLLYRVFPSCRGFQWL